MSFGFWDFISGGASKLVDSVGDAIDKLSTTEEEKLQLKNELEKSVEAFKIEATKAQNEYEKQLTERQKNDMVSDSWLSKNVRPMMLIFLSVSTIALAFASVFGLSTDEVEKIKAWTPLLTSLLITAYGFYFGGRDFIKNKIVQKKSKE